MKRKIFLLLLLCFVLSLSACAPGVQTAQVWAYDTLCTAKIWGGRDSAEVFETAAAEGEKLLSSDGSKQFIASSDGETVPLNGDLYRILSKAQTLYFLTGGVFDLTVAPLSDLWDVNSAAEPPSGKDVARACSLVGWDQVTLTENGLTFARAGMGIDIGSVGKGYGADKTVEALKKAGAEAGVISFGGNVALFGTKDGDPFQVGIRDPKNSGSVLGTLTLTDVSVVTSGAYERYFEYDGTVYHHLLDAVSGYPRQSDLLSVTVVCADGAQADLMSTALWLMGADEGWKLYEVLCETDGFLPSEVIFVLNDGTVRVSAGLKDFFSLTAEGYTLEES